MQKLESSHTVDASLTDVWDFFKNPHNLGKLMPPEMLFRMTSSAPARIYPGLLITYRFSPFLRLPFRWTSEIAFVKEREYFIDEQVSGPFKLWHHEHHFKAQQNQTLIKDILYYQLPIDPVGKLFNQLFVRKKLELIFAQRKVQTELILNTGKT